MLFGRKQTIYKHEWHDHNFQDSIPFYLLKQSKLFISTHCSSVGLIALPPLTLTLFKTRDAL